MTPPNQLSFLPDDYLAKKAARRATIMGAGLFVVVAAGIAGAFMVTDRDTRRLEREHEVVVTQYTEAARRIEQVKVLQDKQRTMAQEAELTASLLEKVPRGNILAEVTNSMPAGLSLLEFSLESKEVKAPPPKPPSSMTLDEQKKALEEKEKLKKSPPPPQPKLYDVYIKLTGIAKTDVQVAQFITKLSASKLLKDVNLVITDEYTLPRVGNQAAKDPKDDEKLRKFQIECMVNPAAQITTADLARSQAAGRATAAVELGAR